MKITHQKQQRNKKNAIGVLAAGVAGAVALAGVAVAATAVLQDEKNRKKVKDALLTMKDQAKDYVETFKTDPHTKEAVKTLKKVSTETKKVVKEK